MKRLVLLLVAMVGFQTAMATHVSGGNISYECLGANQYEITLTLYRDCNGIAAPASANISIANTCGITTPTNVTLTQQGFTEVSQLCPTDIANSACNGGTLPGMQEYTYTAIVTLPPCDTWTFDYELCCRNNAITNVSGASADDIYVESTLNSATAPCNSSPVVTAQPIPYVCTGQPVFYDYGVQEADGNTLVFSLISAMDGNGVNVTYNAGFSGANPIPGITIDPNTGQLSFTPTATGNYVVTILIEEYDASGNLVGTMVQDIQFVVQNCTNQVPLPPAGGISNFSGTATQNGTNGVSMCGVGESFCLDFDFSDNDPTNNLTITSNVTSILPGATMSVTGTNPATVTICWTNGGVYNGTSFSVTAEDDGCPINGFTTFTVDLDIAPTLVASGATTYCGNGSALLSAIGAGPFTWSVVSGEPMNVGTNFSCNPCSNPTASPSTTTTYEVVDACGQTDQVTVTVANNLGGIDATVTTADQTICPGECVNLNGTTEEDLSVNQQQTFSASPNSGISSANPTTISTINVNGLCDNTFDPGDLESVCLNLTHTFTADLDIFLICPGGTTLELSTDNGGGGDNMSNTCFTIGATQSITAGTAPFIGNFIPEGGSLDAFVGCNTNGNWTLQITDDAGGDVGTLLSWSLTFNDQCTATGPATSFDWTPTTNMTGSGSLSPTVCPTVTTTYTLTAYDANGCFDTDDVTITVTPLPAPTAVNTAESCDGANDGTITVTQTGGTAPYDFALTGPVTQTLTNVGSPQTFSNLPDGSYTITVTDANGCQGTVNATVAAGPPITANFTYNGNQCFDTQNFNFTDLSTGATAWSWDFGAGATPATSNAQNPTGVTYSGPGTYTVTLTASVGACSGTFSQNITVYPEPTVTANGTNIDCFGANNGTVSANAVGGSGGFTYAWDNGAGTGATATGLGPNTYTVVVTDVNGCTDTDSYTVTEPTDLTANISASSDITCNGDNDGTATVAAGGGTPGYTYNWVPAPGGGQSTANATGLLPQLYTVTVTDAEGCTETATFTPVEPAAIVVNVASTDATCGQPDGTVSITGTAGGSGIYVSTVWEDGAGNPVPDPNAVTSGSYTVTVTDDQGCTGQATVAVNDLTGPTVTVTGQTNVSCNGGNDGTASVNVTGGSAPYTYAWSPAPSGGQGTANATGLSEGTYSIDVTDNTGCTASASVTITEPTLLTATATADAQASCNPGCDGDATVTPNGGTAPYTYGWPSGETTASATNLCVGNNTVTITDALGCVTTADVTITQFNAPTLAIAGTDADCNGACDGSADGTTTGGTAPFNYTWAHGPTNEDLNGVLCAGTYDLTVTDANGCADNASVTINEPPAITVNAPTTIDNTCNASCDGEVNITAAGGTAPLSYEWFDGSGTSVGTTTNVTGLCADTYDLTVTDGNGCTETSTATINEPPVLTVNGNSTPSNCGQADGSLTANGAGGTPAYNYEWFSDAGLTTSVGTGQNLTNMAAGTYYVQVTDGNGCTADVSVTINDNSAGTLSSTHINADCNGAFTGSIDLTVAGGTAPYTYAWAGPNGFTDNTEDLTGLEAGTYDVTVTDDVGCVLTETVTITEPDAIVLNPTGTDAICFGSADGEVNVSAIGGTPAYTFDWYDNAALTSAIGTGANQTGLTAGTYYVEITDGNGCTADASVTIGEPDAIIVTVSSIDANCGQADGSVSVDATIGGSGVYVSEDWVDTGGNPVANINAVAAGSYTVTVTDDQGCTGTATIGVNDLAGPTASVNTVQNVTCFGECDGTAQIDVTGGDPPFTYNWTPAPGAGQGTDSATDMCAGTYTVTVTDANGCVDNVDVTILEPPVLDIQITASTDVTVNGAADGTADAAATGGTTPYTYAWYDGCPPATANGQTGTNATGLPSGDYSVIVEDAKGCLDTTCVTINEPNAITSVMASTDATCNSGCDGSASVVASGGVGAFTYNWFDATTGTAIGQIGTTASNLCAGDYYVVVTDANGGTHQSASVTVNEPTAVSVTAAVLSNYNGQDVSCNGACDGSAEAAASGGTGPYTYLWDNPAGTTTATVNGLCAGTFTVDVLDANNCPAQNTVVINEPALLDLTPSSTDASCFGTSDGTGDVVVTGGTAPYSYQWNDPALTTTNNVTGLPAGTYNVDVTDANGCTDNASITIAEPTEIILSSTTVGSNCGQTDGSATVNVVQGDAPYTYQWDASAANQTTATANNLGVGCYTVTVTDANGCTMDETPCVQDLGAPTLSLLTQTDASCNGSTDGFIQVQVTGGTTPYSYQWFDGTNNPIGGPSPTPTLTGGADTYTAEMTDGNGCIATISVDINEPTPLNASITNTTDVTCFGDTDGAATVLASGATAPYNYQWNDALGQTTATATDLAPGAYNVDVTDANGCTFSISATIGEPLEILLSTTTVDAFCNTGSGSATVTIDQGSVAPVSYNWVPGGQSSQTATGLTPGTYDVTVSDADGCTQTASATVGNIPAGTATISNSTDVSCFGGGDGTATVSMAGGNAPFTYEWFNDATGNPIGQTGQTATGLTIGTYYVVVTDVNTCQATSNTVTIGQPNDIAITFNVNDANCFGTCTGQADANVTGGTAPYNYLWNNALQEVTPTAQSLCAQTYTVQVTDDNGCIASADVTIGEPTPVTADSTVTNANCGLPDGQGCVLAGGGTAPYTYTWPSGNTNSCETGLLAGTYIVEVRDANDCIINIPVEIQDLNGPSAAITAQSDALCFNACDGSATVDMVGGAGTSFTVQWDANAGSQATPTASNLCAGTYAVTITDNLGCNASANVTIGEPDVLQFVMNNTDAECFGYADASVWVNVAGGTMPYAYNWVDNGGNNLGTTDSISGLPAGTYNVSILDANGCPQNGSVTVNEPPAVSANSTYTDVQCFGACDGTATANGLVGVAPFSYQWDDPNAQGTQVASNLCPGAYTATVTGADGCFTTTSITITEPALLEVNIGNSGNVSCYSACDGFAQATATGGTAPYDYSWSNNGGVNPNALNLCSGNYTITVTDDNGCTATDNVAISQPNPLATSSSFTNVTCYQACNGTAGVTPSGGTPPYQYQWDNPTFSTTPSVTGLCAGTYSVVITDQNGCSITQSFVITQPTQLGVNPNISNSNCGQPNGSIATNVFGGVVPYVYQWNDPNTTTSATLSNVIAGCYNITIVDANGCSADSLFCINDIAGPTVTPVNAGDVSCNGAQDGFVEFNVTGGTAPVTYEMINSAGTNVANNSLLENNLDGECYTLIATDAAGCIGTDVICINEPNALNSAITSHLDVNCYLGSDGEATVSVSGGIQPYTYAWNGGAAPTAANNTGLSAQTYTVTVTDANNCTTQSSITIDEPTQLDLALANQINVSCNGLSDGSVDVLATGATPPYIYNWTPNVSAGPQGNALPAGVYGVDVVDANGCLEAISITITEPQPLNLTLNTDNSTCTQCNGAGTIVVNGGTTPYNYNWLNGGNNPVGTTNTGLCPGSHTVEVTDANGCLASITETVIDEPSPSIDGFNITQPLCNGLSNGSAEVLVSGGTGTYTYQWDAAAANQNVNPAVALSTGQYCVTVSDANNCQVTNCTTVSEPTPLLPIPDGTTTICYGDSTQVWASGQGGTAPYTINWIGTGFTGGGPITVDPLLTTDYCFTVSDNNGCLSPQGCVTIDLLPALTSSLVDSVALCDGDDITATLTVSGGNGGPYTMDWTDNTGAPVIANQNGNISEITIQPGNSGWYYIEISDGCSLDIIDSVFVQVNANPTLAISALDSAGCEPFLVQFITNSDIGTNYQFDFECDGTVDLVTPNANPTYTYNNAGSYDVCVTTTTDDGCTSSITITDMITVYPLPVADFLMDPSITTLLNPTITFTNTSTGGVYYEWDFGDGYTIAGDTGVIFGNDTHDGMTSGTYMDPVHTYQDTGYFDVTLTITSENGCVDQVTYQVYVEGDYILFAPTAFSPNGDGINDFFFPQGVGLQDGSFEMYIYNRWGEVIFESNSPDDPWDGTFRGVQAKVDVYVWLIRTTDPFGQPHEYLGHVTIVR